MTPKEWTAVEKWVKEIEASLDAVREQVTRLKHHVRRQGVLPIQQEPRREPYGPWTCPHVEPCNGKAVCRVASELGRPERKAVER